MIYLGYISIILSLIQFFISLINLIFLQKFNNHNENNDLVSILIPVRNEEDNIENLLNDLITQNYKYIEILLFNDASTDTTEEILKRYSQKYNYINYINSFNLPEGWLGKNYGCYNLAQNAKGKYFLFLDADVRISGNIINSCLNYMKDKKLSLLSIFPKQEMLTFGEKIIVPIMNYILLTLLPLFLVRKSRFVSLSAANGQFMLFESETYKKLNPHFQFKHEKVEDIKIARFYKKMKKKIACLVGRSEISCRMYSNYHEALNGFSKNISTFFGSSYFLALLFWFFTTFGAIIIYIVFRQEIFWLYLIIYIFTRIFVSISSNQNILINVFFSIFQQISFACILINSLFLTKTKKLKWKNRNIQ